MAALDARQLTVLVEGFGALAFYPGEAGREEGGSTQGRLSATDRHELTGTGGWAKALV
jgi:hypothetical protein